MSIHIFHCSWFDADAEQPMLPREETELKRRICEALRSAGRHRAVEDALGVKTLEFGGDCAAGLKVDLELQPGGGYAQELVFDAVDRYEANYAGDWMPCVVRRRAEDDAGTVLVDLYAPGSFWSEMLNHTEDVEVEESRIRPRQWEVCRGEVLKIPDHEVLTLHHGQHLWVQSRGPGHDEPAGRLETGEGAYLRCDGGTVENEGILSCLACLQYGAGGQRRYRVEIESTKTVLVDCVDGIPDLPVEERGVALQCFSWIFERAYRQMQLRTLGGRGWYLAEEGQSFPKRQGQSQQHLPPRVFLYKGFVATTCFVARGPCLKVDTSVRMIQGQTALAKLSFFRDLLIRNHEEQGLPFPTKDEVDAFLQKQMVGRTCMTRHNQIHYRIQKICIDMDPLSTFPLEEGEITYLEYFQRRHGITLERQQPMLYVPFRSNMELYLPAELGFLTGLDEDWRADRELSQELWASLRHPPAEHWALQSRLVDGLRSENTGRALREWGVSVDSEPLRVNFGELEHEPVYFSRKAEDHFCRLSQPPSELEVQTDQHGFERRPWPQVWLRPGAKLVLDRWVIFCANNKAELEWVDRFVKELEPMVGQLLEEDGKEKRLVLARPVVVPISANSVSSWAKKVAACQLPWPQERTKFAIVVIPSQARRRDQYYYQLKTLLSFQSPLRCPTQMILGSTLQRDGQRQQVWRSILQQILVKLGAFLWVFSPLPYAGRSIMVVGIDSTRKAKDSPVIQALSASDNVYFTSFFTTWQVQKSGETPVPPGGMLREAVLNYFDEVGRLPDTVVIYRGGTSESQEASLIETEIHHPQAGLLAALHAAADEVGQREGELDEVKAWRSRLEVAFIMARRSMTSRFRTEDWENLPSGSFICEGLVPQQESLTRFDFYMVSQTFIVGTAKPTFYSMLYSTLTWTRYEIIQLTYRLCGVYMTFPGMVSLPAPLKYVTKLLSLLSKCSQCPLEPPGPRSPWRSNLFFV